MINKDRRDESRLVYLWLNLQKMRKNHALHSAAAVFLKCCPKSEIASLQNVHFQTHNIRMIMLYLIPSSVLLLIIIERTSIDSPYNSNGSNGVNTKRRQLFFFRGSESLGLYEFVVG